MSKHVVPMYESERGWSAGVDGYAGPFDSKELATEFAFAYNKKHNSERVTPDYYIKALEPEPFSGQKCEYKSTL